MNDEMKIWRTVCAALVLLLLCSCVACGAETEVAEAAAADAANWAPVAWGIGGSALTGTGAWVWSKLHRVRIDPQPLEVQMKQEFVTRGEFKALTDRVDGITSSLAELKGSQKYQTELLQSINTHLIHKAL